MKKYLCIMGAWVATAVVTASGQTSSSGGGQSTTSGTQGTTSSQGTTSGAQGTTSSANQQNQQNLPPGLQNRDQLPPGLANRTNSNSAVNFGATNQFRATNQLGGTPGVGTNNAGLYPTGRAGETNRTYGTNSSGFRGGSSYGTNGGSSGTQRGGFGDNDREGGNREVNDRERNDREGGNRHRDEAVTTQDRTLLFSIRQTVQTEVREVVNAQGAWAPVNFRIEQGVVTILGTVETAEISQRIEECVRRVPGVVRVENTIEIGGGGAVSGAQSVVGSEQPVVSGGVAVGSGQPVVSGGVAVGSEQPAVSGGQPVVSGGVSAVGSGESDEVVATRVRERILPIIGVRGIDVECHNGVVTVMGTVPQPAVKEQLVSLTRKVPGVVDVTDQVTVGPEVKGQARLRRPQQTRERQIEQTRTGTPEQTREGPREQTRVGTPEQTREGQPEEQQAVSAAVSTTQTNLPPTGRDNLPAGQQNPVQPPPELLKRTNNVTQPQL